MVVKPAEFIKTAAMPTHSFIPAWDSVINLGAAAMYFIS